MTWEPCDKSKKQLLAADLHLVARYLVEHGWQKRSAWVSPDNVIFLSLPGSKTEETTYLHMMSSAVEKIATYESRPFRDVLASIQSMTTPTPSPEKKTGLAAPLLVPNRLQNDFEDYKKFAFSKNLIAMAAAFILMNTIQKTTTSLSNSLLMPIVNYFVSKEGNGNWRNLIFTPVAGMDIEIGAVCSALLEFLITTIVLYVFYFLIFKRLFGIKDDDPISP